MAKVDLSRRPFKFWVESGEDQAPHTADSLILATGASARRLNLPGEETYWQNGVSACAVCDGAVPIFRKKPLVRLKNTQTGQEEEMEANGLFYAVGHDPATALVKGQIDTDADGYVLTKPGTSYTNIPGVFAAGDVQDKRYRQAITSAGRSPPCLD